EAPAEEAAEEAAPSKGVVTVLGTWGGDELASFQEAVFPFTDETGIGMAFEGTRDLAAVLTIRVEAGNPPDLAILPNPGQMYELAESGELVDISQFMDMGELETNYTQAWLDLAMFKTFLRVALDIFISVRLFNTNETVVLDTFAILAMSFILVYFFIKKIKMGY
ncbi:unnamed protein product, partial [marine sediment metagenome]